MSKKDRDNLIAMAERLTIDISQPEVKETKCKHAWTYKSTHKYCSICGEIDMSEH